MRDLHRETLIVIPEANAAETLEPSLACMGAAACSRICEYGGDFENSDIVGGLPLEQSCSNLEDLEVFKDMSPSAQVDLVRTTLLPTIELGPTKERDTTAMLDVKTEVHTTIESLQVEQAAFDEYLEAILQKAPRYVLKDKKDALQEAKPPSLPEELDDESKTSIQVVRNQARAFYDLDTLKADGILYDQSARATMERASQSIALGYHVALSGEPGVAKTTLAKHVVRLNALAHHGHDAPEELLEPVVLSFSSTSEAESNISEQTFEDNTLGKQLGVLAEAMQQGRGVVLDEYNGMSADQSIFLNELLLRKPGDTVVIAGHKITIENGFCVIATLNPMTDTQGNRRHGRQQQDSAGAERFDRIDVELPGSPAYEGNARETIHRLFMSSWVNHYGWQLPSTQQLELARETTQFITDLAEKATKPVEDGTGVVARVSVPLISKCITPRALGRLLNKSMTHAELSDVDRSVRRAITEDTNNILKSNNGHILSSGARDAVTELLRRNNMDA